jgi:tetratricopeptide repeat protein 30
MKLAYFAACSTLIFNVCGRLMQILPTNRAALSLLGHCYYHQGLHDSACQAYETLVHLFPGRSAYRLYHAQSLYKAGDLVEAARVLEVISEHPKQVEQLKMGIAYTSDQSQECRRMLRTWPPDSPETAQNEGCILYKEGEYRYKCPCDTK